MRIVIIGDYEFHRIKRPLLADGHQIIVISTRPPTSALDECVDWRIVGSSDDQIALASNLKADIVLPRVRGTENEAAILDYALHFHGAPEGALSVHSPQFAEVAVDKGSFNNFAIANGIAIPTSQLCISELELKAAVVRFGGYPVIAKKCRAASTTGTFLLKSDTDLAEFSPDEVRAGLLMQQTLTGVEIGVEIISSPFGNWRFPIAYLGRTGSDINPLARVRHAPYLLSAHHRRELSDVINRITKLLMPCGPWQLDAIVANDRVHVLEINARLGGLANLSMFTTGVDPHELAYRVATGVNIDAPTEKEFAVEFPVPIGFEFTGEIRGGVQFQVQPSRTLPNWRMLASGNTPEIVARAISTLRDDILDSATVDHVLAELSTTRK